MVEIFFGIVQRQAFKHGIFHSVQQLVWVAAASLGEAVRQR